MNEPKKKKGQHNEAFRYFGMAGKMAIIILAGVWLGRWLDEDQSFPLFTLVFSILSVAMAIYVVIKDTAR